METKSLCPECMAVVTADIIREGDRMLIVKKCKDHGEFKDHGHFNYYSDI